MDGFIRIIQHTLPMFMILGSSSYAAVITSAASTAGTVILTMLLLLFLFALFRVYVCLFLSFFLEFLVVQQLI